MEVEDDQIDPQFLHGFTPEQLEDPQACLFSGGLQRFFEARSALQALQLMRRGGSRAEVSPGHTPAWQNVSGLTPDNERNASPRERAEMIFGLLKSAEKLVRFELKEEQARYAKRGSVNVLENGRSRAWDPVRSVCFHLEISQRKLTAYAREVMGISAWELADAVRAEGVRARMKTELKAFVAGFFGSRKNAKGPGTETATSTTEDTESTEGKEGAEREKGGRGEGEKGGRADGEKRGKGGGGKGRGGNGGDAILDEIWRALKGSRRAPKFHRGSWALSFGFSSYTRFYRACLNCYAMTPHELEFALIEEILDEAEDKKNNCDSGHEGNEDRQKELEELTAGEVEFVKRE